jgi:hypothetical protein
MDEIAEPDIKTSSNENTQVQTSQEDQQQESFSDELPLIKEF